MPKKSDNIQNQFEEEAIFGTFRFSDPLLKDMAEYLAKRYDRPVSLDEADSSLKQLVCFVKWTLGDKRSK
jgi:hypothetical protein